MTSNLKKDSGFEEAILTALKSNLRKTARQGDSEEGNLELEFRIGNFYEDRPGRGGRGGVREARFRPALNLVTFKNVLETLRSQAEDLGIQENKASEGELTLDVSLDQRNKFLPKSLRHARSTIEGNNIGAFCSTDQTSLENKVSLTKTDLPDWGMRLKSSREIPVTESRLNERFNEILADPRYHKFYRLKKRRSFLGDGFRVDATMVKEGSGPSYEKSNVQSRPEHYEVEIERTSEDTLTESGAEAWLAKVLPTLKAVKRAQEGAPDIVSNVDKNEAKIEYKVAFFDERERAKPVRNDRRLFIGMEVHPLEPRHILPGSNNEIPLTSGKYYVTVKADGMRNLLFFAKNGRGYLIDRGMNIRWSGLTIPDLAGAMFDGEYISNGGGGPGGKDRFLIFDYLRSPGNVADQDEDLRGEAFSVRLEKLKEVYSDIIGKLPSEDTPLQVELKNHHSIPKAEKLADSLDPLLEEVLSEAKNNGYEEDGFIFTPNEPYPKASITTMVKWPNLLKWKPPEKLSNDFKVQKERSRVTKQPEVYTSPEGKQFQILQLLSSYEGVPKKFVYPGGGFVDGVDNISRVPIGPDGQIRTLEDKQVIYDGNIIEFIWGTLPWKDAAPGRANNVGWIPLRARYDKRTPNRIETAASNWELIRKHPVSLEMLKGEEEVPFDYYYTAVDESLRNLTSRMRSFHNQVKGDLISETADAVRKDQIARGIRPEEVEIHLLDLGVGEAGDLFKWNKAGITTVLGIDSSLPNIEGQPKGAQQRYAEALARDPKGFKVKPTFVWGDAGKNIRKSLKMDLSEVSKEDLPEKIEDSAAGDPYYHNVLQSYFEERKKYRIKEGFNIISIQFALHYFMESREKLENLLRNVSEQLLPGGYFIGTSLDGVKVHMKLSKSPSGVISGKRSWRRGKDSPRVDVDIWKIRRKYDTNEIPDPDDQNLGVGEDIEVDIGFGKRVDAMNISIGPKEIPEWLMDFKALSEIGEKYGLTPTELGNFREGIGSFKDYTPARPVRPGQKSAKSAMSEAEKDYSFMNKYFILQKTGLTPQLSASSTVPPTRVKPDVVLKTTERVTTSPASETITKTVVTAAPAVPAPAVVPAPAAVPAPAVPATGPVVAQQTAATTPQAPKVRLRLPRVAPLPHLAAMADAAASTAPAISSGSIDSGSVDSGTPGERKKLPTIKRLPTLKRPQ